MTEISLVPHKPNCETRFQAHWRFVEGVTEEHLKEFPLPPSVCKACFLIFYEALYNYVLPGHKLVTKSVFQEIRDIYVSTFEAYINVKKSNENAVRYLMFDFKLALHCFVEKFFLGEYLKISNSIEALSNYQERIWNFCMNHHT